MLASRNVCDHDSPGTADAGLSFVVHVDLGISRAKHNQPRAAKFTSFGDVRRRLLKFANELDDRLRAILRFYLKRPHYHAFNIERYV